MIKLCIFDIGGVLCHDDISIVPKINEFLGNPMDTPYMDLFPSFKELFESYESGLIEEDEIWKAYERETKKVIKDYGESLFTKYFNPTIHEPTLKIIERLKERNIRVVAGTNVLPSHYKYHMEHGQYSVFDKVYGSNIMKIRKPSVEFFKQILKEENVEAKYTFFTDDREINIESAGSLGINTYLYKDEVGLEDKLIKLGALS